MKNLIAKIIIAVALIGGCSQFAEAKSVKTRMIIVLETRISVVVSPIKVINVTPIQAVVGLKRGGFKHTSTEHGHFILTLKRRGLTKTAFINITDNKKLSKMLHSVLKTVAKKQQALKRRNLRK